VQEQQYLAQEHLEEHQEEQQEVEAVHREECKAGALEREKGEQLTAQQETEEEVAMRLSRELHLQEQRGRQQADEWEEDQLALALALSEVGEHGWEANTHASPPQAFPPQTSMPPISPSPSPVSLPLPPPLSPASLPLPPPPQHQPLCGERETSARHGAGAENQLQVGRRVGDFLRRQQIRRQQRAGK
jgi:hypothetical protein